MAAYRPSSDLKNKTNVNTVNDRTKEVTADDFNEMGTILENHADLIDENTEFIKELPISVGDLKGVVNVTGNIIQGSHYNGIGIITNRTESQRTEFIELNQLDEVWVQANSDANVYNCFFDINQDWISGENILSNIAILTKVVIPSNAVYIGLSSDNIYTLKIEKRYVGYEELNSLPVDVAVLDTKVTEFDSVGLLISDVVIQDAGYYKRDTGVLTSNSGFRNSGVFSIINKTLQYTGILGGSSGNNIVFFDENEIYLGFFQSDNNVVDAYISAPTGAVKAVVSKSTSVNFTVKLVGNITKIPAQLNEINKDVTTNNGKSYFELGSNSKKIRDISLANPDHYAFMILGQSNVGAHALFPDLATLGIPSSLPIYRFINNNAFSTPYILNSPTLWGIDWSLLNKLNTYLVNDVYYYKNYQGSTSITDEWNADLSLKGNTNRLSRLIDDIPVMQGLKSDLKFKFCLWIQGEADSISGNDKEYYWRLKQLIQFVRGVNNNPYMPFIVVGMHPNQGQFSEIVRGSQMRAVEETTDAYFIDPSGLTFSSVDGTHYDGVYNETLSQLIFDTVKDF